MQIYLLSGENFYGQIQARSGSHWALDLPVATEGEDTAPSGNSGPLLEFCVLSGEILKNCS